MPPAGSKNAPEAKAREKIDALLMQSGWLVQDREDMNLTVSDGIAVREFKLEKGHGFVDFPSCVWVRPRMVMGPLRTLASTLTPKPDLP